MRKIGIGAALLIFAAGVLLGAWKLHKTTKTILVVRTEAAPSSTHKMHVLITDANAADANGNPVTDCSQDARLPSIANVQVRAPGNGLTEGDLLGIPDQSAAIVNYGDVDGCELSFDVPDLSDARFYVVTDGNIQWTLSNGELKRKGWSVVLNATKQTGE